MNTQRTVAQRLDEETAYAGVHPRDNQVSALEEVTNNNQSPFNPQP